ncbi:hypothetical protein [Kitasatospora sp. DSM 101779]|uniref:hypothetical protein n=1 Tax=Kitasatospora sp. DSM 101779 TaxID=2853165 RepID=UPI0021DA4E54|nr:hypothetical protein [Kitasatospora sp. DSM 101779]MCU7827381.1 hypothetical protein [Kitasatospora sp. DSM 101779]
MTWGWEYNPDEHTVAAGAPPAFIAQVEKKADEIVRAAAALYLDGTTYQGPGEGMKSADVEDGIFWYMIVPRDERIYILLIQSL